MTTRGARLFAPEEWEVLVQVIDGRDLNDHLWVFSSSAAGFEHELIVTDTSTDEGLAGPSRRRRPRGSRTHLPSLLAPGVCETARQRLTSRPSL